MIEKGIPTYYCMPQKSELSVGGTFLTAKYRLIEIKLYKCMNSSDSNITCATEEEQYNYFKFRPLVTRYINAFIDPSNHT